MVRLTETVLTGAQVALVGGQIARDDLLASAAALDALPYAAVEVMSPALARVLVTRLAESPFDRIRVLRKVMPKATLMVTLDTRCGLGDRLLDATSLARVVKALAEAGVDRFRLAATPSDVEPLRAALAEVRTAGKGVEVLLTPDAGMCSAVDTLTAWCAQFDESRTIPVILTAQKGVLAPSTADRLVRALKGAGFSVGLALSDQAGLATASYYAAATAGADFLDTALGPFAGGKSFPATESMVFALSGGDRDTGMKPAELKRVAETFVGLRARVVTAIARQDERVDTSALDTSTPSPGATPPIPKASTVADVEAAHGELLKRPDDGLLVVQYGEAALPLLKGELKPKPLETAGVRAYDVAVDGESFHVEVHPSSVGLVVKPKVRPAASAPRPTPRPAPQPAPVAGGRPAPTGAASAPPRPAPTASASQGSGKPTEVPCPMQGTIVRILVKVGDRVERAGRVAVLEAMKMENDIITPTAGTVTKVLVQPGDAVQAGQALVVVEP